MTDPCPCGLESDYAHCCGRFIEGQAVAATPTELMRSRYTAYVKHKLSYITSTMKGPALKQFEENGSIDTPSVRWARLNVLREKLTTHIHGFVTFEAYYHENGAERVLCEKSEFKKIGNRWYYIDGKYLKPKMS